MTSLAQVADLDNLPELDTADYTTEQLQKVLDMATSTIVADLGWEPLEADRVLTLRPTGCGEAIVLPARNVTAVELTVDGTVLDPELVDWTTPGSVIYLRSGRVTRAGSVAYTAGYAEGEIPPALVDACVDLAVALLDNPRRLRTWRAGEATETYAEILREHDARLAKYRLPPAIA